MDLFCKKNQTANIWGSEGHMVSVATTQIRCCSVQAAAAIGKGILRARIVF